MCELLNRIWSRPRGEWTRVLRRELPALAGEIVEELLHGIPGLSALVDDNDAIDDELLRQRVEYALLVALGYREEAEPDALLGAGVPHEAEERHDGTADAVHGGARPEGGREPGPTEVRAHGHGSGGHGGSGTPQTGPDGSAAPQTGTGDGAAPQTGPGTRGGVPLQGGVPTQRGVPAQRGVPTHDSGHPRDSGHPHGAGHPHNAGHPHGDGSAGVRPEPTAPQDRARQELFKALTDDRDTSHSSLTELAEAAGWPLPEAVRAIAPATPGETLQLATVLDEALPGMFAGRPCLLLPVADPDARAALELPLRGRSAAVGHAVPLRDTASSLRWALRLLTLTPHRAGPDARPVFVDDHLSTLLLLQDEPLAHALAARWLRPLADLTPRQSERLEVTLLAWLEGGGAPEAAKALSVHPQTVRYRMRQLEKLFGPGLRDPRTRFELEMALRSRRLMAHVRRQHSRAGRRTGRVVTADFTPLVVGRMARVNGL
ncbi:helix-turn-helix domain-containing protein [Streptomyces sp. NPDC002033]|uniref:helix-turn-helix domain-containing protein n=1 Tax=unclassified Streptomyces TaxID=2593676 RepID=UPI00331DAD81